MTAKGPRVSSAFTGKWFGEKKKGKKKGECVRSRNDVASITRNDRPRRKLVTSSDEELSAYAGNR